MIANGLGSGPKITRTLGLGLEPSNDLFVKTMAYLHRLVILLTGSLCLSISTTTCNIVRPDSSSIGESNVVVVAAVVHDNIGYGRGHAGFG